MSQVEDVVARVVAETGFAGVVQVDRGLRTEFAGAYGLADRRHGVPMTLDALLATASATKGFTALAVMRLVEQGLLGLDTTARSLLGDDLPLVADDVTIEQLLAHRSGIGDYLDEDELGDVNDYIMPVPVHELATAEQYLAVLDGFPTAFAAGERFSYCNGGYVLLALLAERAAGRSYHDLVRELVCAPAGLTDTEFLRSDELPPRAATGYLDAGTSLRTNVLHLPVVGVGDAGLYTTVDDVHRFWTALFDGRIVAPSTVAEMVRPRSTEEADGDLRPRRYGLGFWLHPSSGAVMLEGCDAGVSFLSVHEPSTHLTHTVVGTDANGAWPVAAALRGLLTPYS